MLPVESLEQKIVSGNNCLLLFAINRNIVADAASVLLAVSLLTIQCTRRFYDTHFVSVFGKNSRMDLSHYIIGLIHYPGAFLAILCEAPMFTNNGMF